MSEVHQQALDRLPIQSGRGFRVTMGNLSIEIFYRQHESRALTLDDLLVVESKPNHFVVAGLANLEYAGKLLNAVAAFVTRRDANKA